MNKIITLSPVIRFVSADDNVLSTREQGTLRVRSDNSFGAIRRGKCYPVFDVSEDGKTVSVRIDKALAEAKDDCRVGKIVDLGLPTKSEKTEAKADTPKKPRTEAQQKATVAMCEKKLAKLVAEDADEEQVARAAKAVGTAQENLAAMLTVDATPEKPVSKMTKAELVALINKLNS